MKASIVVSERAQKIAEKVEDFVREIIVPYERDPRCGSHGPTDELLHEMRAKAKAAGVLTPHVLADGSHLSQRETATVLIRSGLSPLGPLAVNTMAPDEGQYVPARQSGNTGAETAVFWPPYWQGEVRSAFFMTETGFRKRSRLGSFDDGRPQPNLMARIGW